MTTRPYHYCADNRPNLEVVHDRQHTAARCLSHQYHPPFSLGARGMTTDNIVAVDADADADAVVGASGASSNN